MMMFLMSSLPEIYIKSELNLKGLSLEFFGILFFVMVGYFWTKKGTSDVFYFFVMFLLV
jgi:hypothetical protein